MEKLISSNYRNYGSNPYMLIEEEKKTEEKEELKKFFPFKDLPPVLQFKIIGSLSDKDRCSLKQISLSMNDLVNEIYEFEKNIIQQNHLKSLEEKKLKEKRRERITKIVATITLPLTVPLFLASTIFCCPIECCSICSNGGNGTYEPFYLTRTSGKSIVSIFQFALYGKRIKTWCSTEEDCFCCCPNKE